MANSDLQFLKASLSDLDLLLDWVRRYYAFDHIPFDALKVESALKQLFQNPDYGHAYFVQLNQKTVGYFLVGYNFDIEYGGRHAAITDLFFSEEVRRGGIGTRTLQFIEKLCREEGLSNLFLQVEIDNVEAQAFYQKMGFELHTRYSMNKSLS